MTRSPRNVYTTLNRVRSYMSLASQNTDDDESIKAFIRTSSRAIENFTKRKFYPERKTRHYDLPDNPRILRLEDEDLLEVKGLSDINGASEVDSSVYFLKQGNDYNETPYDRIELDIQSGSILNYSGTPQKAVYLDGIWGYHEEYDDYAWIDSGASLAASTASNLALFGISGSAERDTLGESPRLDALQTWKLGDEFLHSVSVSGSTFTVQRGVNGTTAASHAAGTTIYKWNPPDDIEYSARQLAAFQYMQATSPRTGQVIVPLLGGAGFEVSEPSSWPPSVSALLKSYKKRRVYSFGSGA